jgi:hypothetical protein
MDGQVTKWKAINQFVLAAIGVTALAFIGLVLAQADDRAAPRHGPSSAAAAAAASRNAQNALRPRGPRSSIVARPFAEYEVARYFIAHVSRNFRSGTAKDTILRTLPDGVVAVLFGSEYEISQAAAHYKKLRKPGLVKFMVLDGDGFWARDGLPIPVYLAHGSGKTLGLVDAQYYHGFEPDEQVSWHFSSELLRHGYNYEGGNFLPDTRGNCLLVRNNMGSGLIPDSVFREDYGCKRIVRLPLISGIGHVDEHVKFLTDKLAVTDRPEYKQAITELGYKVALLPDAGGMRTYVNSLLVNGIIYMPAYGTADDEEAAKVYRFAGFQVYPVGSEELSDDGQGSIHCITMTYPESTFREDENDPDFVRFR